jgi:hypothetical protein
MASSPENILSLEAEIQQLKLQLSGKDSKLADITQKANAAITKLKGEIASLKANGAPHDAGPASASDSAQNIQELIKARDEAVEEVTKVKEQAKKHLVKIKSQHADELAALRQSLQTSAGDSNPDANVQVSNSSQEILALKEELAKVNL